MEHTDVLPGFGTTVARDTLHITEMREIEGEPWFFLASRFGHPFLGGSGEQTWLTVRKDGLWKRLIDGNTVSDPWQLIKFPLEVGQEWISESGMSFVRTGESEEVLLEGGERVQSVPYSLSSTDTYRPFLRATGHAVQFEFYPVNERVNAEYKLSEDLGFVELRGILVTIDEDEKQFRVVGDYELNLIQFIPGGLQ